MRQRCKTANPSIDSKHDVGQEKLGCESDKPVSFVFHGGSGSSLEDIRYAIEAGVVKMNIDTDTQWAFWDGMNEYQKKNKDYLQAQKLWLLAVEKEVEI